MKVIFSRKGFGSGWGGSPSPILPDGRMVSLPIPYDDGVPYTDLRLDGYGSYTALMRDLGITSVNRPRRPPVTLSEALAHFDPDVVASAADRLPGWKPLFGQIGAAQGHLEHYCVGPGDLLLFYGWFQETLLDDDDHLRRIGDKVQALSGYLEIDTRLVVSETPKPPAWARDHAHFRFRDRPHFAKANTVYAATDRLSFAPRLPGGGTLGPYRQALRLTRHGETPRVWELPTSRAR